MNHHSRPQPPAKKNGKNDPFSKIPSLWPFVFWLIAGWLIITLIFPDNSGEKRTIISYTEFKLQIKAANVTDVTFKGNEISGQFKSQYIVTFGAENDSIYYQYFATTKPDLEDPELVHLLESNAVTIRAETESESWLNIFLISFLPWILIIAFFIYISRRAQNQMQGMMGGGGLFGIGKSKAKKYQQSNEDVSFDEVAGLENAKRDLREIVEYLKAPEKFTALGANIPKGILLMGPPGTGKTLLARATAGEAGVAFFSISGSEFIEMFVGVGASRVRDMFETAKKEAPSIIFVDEIDSVGRARGTGLGGGHDEREQTLNQILSEMDGFEAHQSVVVIAATNRPDVLDPALTRPGRFDRQITLELPHKKAREEILKIHSRAVPVDSDVNLENLSARTVGFSGADLKNLVNEAALLAGRMDQQKVTAATFDEARDKILLGAEREDFIDDAEKKIIAYHEAGHALVAKLIPDTDPLQKVTIIPRGQALGVTEQLPENERHNLKRRYLLDRIAVMLGGRAAEKLVFGDISNGAASDLKQVTQIARRMVCQWGMSEKLGAVYFRQGEEHLFLGREITQAKDFSEHTAQMIDEEIRNIIGDMESKAVTLLTENRETLDAVAEALLEHETLDNEMIDKLNKDSVLS